jgi:hypothetical protein
VAFWANSRNSYTPPVVGIVKMSVAEVRPVVGGVCKPFRYFQVTIGPASGVVVR